MATDQTNRTQQVVTNKTSDFPELLAFARWSKRVFPTIVH